MYLNATEGGVARSLLSVSHGLLLTSVLLDPELSIMKGDNEIEPTSAADCLRECIGTVRI